MIRFRHRDEGRAWDQWVSAGMSSGLTIEKACEYADDLLECRRERYPTSRREGDLPAARDGLTVTPEEREASIRRRLLAEEHRRFEADPARVNQMMSVLTDTLVEALRRLEEAEDRLSERESSTQLVAGGAK